MDNKIYITDDNGQEREMNILFTFDMNEKNYVIVYQGDDQDNLYAFQYEENGSLYVVEDEEELNQIQEVIDAFDGINDEEEEN